MKWCPVPCPPGGSGGLGPPGISVNYPCLASAAAVPCPRALPPIFFRPKFFSTKKFSAENFSAEIFFGRKFFRPKIFRSKTFSSEFFSSVLPSVRRPSVDRPSVRRAGNLLRGAVTMLGDLQNVEKVIRNKFDFLNSRNGPQQKTGSAEIF